MAVRPKNHAASSPPDGAPRMPGLDGARGLAVLLVLLDHASDAGMKLFPGADLNRAGKYGVYLFFVLSAFLLTHQFSQWKRDDFYRIRTWMHYALRRFLRIFPPYVVVLVAYVLMGKMQWGDVALHLSLREGVHQFWTIPVEVKFYGLLPFIAFAIFGAMRRHWLLGMAAGLVAGTVAWGLFGLDPLWSARPAILLLPSLAPFLFGTALALLYGALLPVSAHRQRLGFYLAIGAAMALLCLVVRLPAVHATLFSSRAFMGKEFDAAICGALWSVVLLGVLLGKGWLSRSLEWPPLRHLGTISFSAYLWHRRFLNDVDDLPVPSVVRLLVYLAIVIAVSFVSYRLIERPLARLRWMAGQKQEQSVPGLPPALAVPEG